MGWTLGKDRIDRMVDGPFIVNVVLCAGRTRRQFEIYEDGILRFRSGPYMNPRSAKKGAEIKLAQLKARNTV